MNLDLMWLVGSYIFQNCYEKSQLNPVVLKHLVLLYEVLFCVNVLQVKVQTASG